jgi:UDP-N-acetylglucosamine 2-epimerase (non-hydrolysing)
MIDTLLGHLKAVAKSSILKKHSLFPKTYAVVTLHRPSNVDSKSSLESIASILENAAQRAELVFPMHPRTMAQIKKHGLEARFRKMPGLHIIDPLGYVDFVRLVKDSLFVLTDSGGIQEEAAVLNVPCLTMRENTERPSTIEQGTNQLVGRDKEKIFLAIDKIMRGKWKNASALPLWDGRASERIVKCLKKLTPRSSQAAKR